MFRTEDRPCHKICQKDDKGQAPAQSIKQQPDLVLRHERDDQDDEQVQTLAQHPHVGGHHEVVDDDVQTYASSFLIRLQGN